MARAEAYSLSTGAGKPEKMRRENGNKEVCLLRVVLGGPAVPAVSSRGSLPSHFRAGREWDWDPQTSDPTVHSAGCSIELRNGAIDCP